MYGHFARQNNFSHILKVRFFPRKVTCRDFSRAKMDFLAMDKIFCHGQKFFVQDNLGFVLDKKYFVRAEGRGISLFHSHCNSVIIFKFSCFLV